MNSENINEEEYILNHQSQGIVRKINENKRYHHKVVLKPINEACYKQTIEFLKEIINNNFGMYSLSTGVDICTCSIQDQEVNDTGLTLWLLNPQERLKPFQETYYKGAKIGIIIDGDFNKKGLEETIELQKELKKSDCIYVSSIPHPAGLSETLKKGIKTLNRPLKNKEEVYVAG